MVLQPNERYIQVQRPSGVPVGESIEVIIDGAPYYVVVPQGIPEGGTFNCKVPLVAVSPTIP